MAKIQPRIPDARSLSDIELARVLWNYHHLNTDLRDKSGEIHADSLIVCGSNETKVADRAAEIFQHGKVKKVVFSGSGIHETLEEKYGEGLTEAEVFAGIARAEGVPENTIIIEKTATCTPENITYSMEELEREKIYPKDVIIVCAPQHERRVLATARKYIPDVDLKVTSPNTSFEEFIDNKEGFQQGRIRALVGHTTRLYLYGVKGDLVHQDIPLKVIEAYRELLRRGYMPLGYESLETDMHEQNVDLKLSGIEKVEEDDLYERLHGETHRTK